MRDVTRRSVIQAGVWSLPVVAVAVAAPAAAASLQQFVLAVPYTTSAGTTRFYPQITNTGTVTATFVLSITSNILSRNYRLNGGTTGGWQPAGSDGLAATLEPGRSTDAGALDGIALVSRDGKQYYITCTAFADGFADQTETILLPIRS